jgi:diguanylate cyclase (GGDEF)-like protein
MRVQILVPNPERTSRSSYRGGALVRLLALAALVLLLQATAAAQQLVRVGVYQNPPIVSREAGDEPGGLSIDILRYAAERENWELEFVWGEWNDLKTALGENRIDLLVGIAYTEERARRYAFNRETLISNWAVVYRHDASAIDSLIDLDGKRVALMKGAVHNTPFRNLMDQFGLRPEIVDVGDYQEALARTDRGEVDATVVNRLFGKLQEPHHLQIHPTTIIFNPVSVRYASGDEARRGLLDALDRHLVELKESEDSLYYRSIDTWLNVGRAARLPGWLLPVLAAAGLLLVAFALLNRILRSQVKARTQELEEQSQTLQREVEFRREAESKLNYLAYFDPLTDLPNRSLFGERLRHAMDYAHRLDQRIAVMFLDIDDFKKINDSLGHSAGDRLLRAVAERISERVRKTDTVARLGGDEFTIVVSSLSNDEDAVVVAQGIKQHLSSTFMLDGHEVFVTVSMGITVFPDDAKTIDGLLKNADTAMYEAKGKGKNGFRFYSEDLSTRVSERLALENRLRRALDTGEFLLNFQPQVRLRDGALIAVEALLRWPDPDEGMIPPGRFIPVAEQAGLIQVIGLWALEASCRQIVAWDAAGIEIPKVAVNLSTRQFQSGDLVDHIERLLDRYRVDGARLDLEITEGLLMAQTQENIAALDRLRTLGCSIAIDDFGTGYASFDYLRRLPLQSIKIDRSFVVEMEQEGRNLTLIKAMIAMGHALGVEVTAEGVEDPDTLATLAELGCDAAQGYHLGRPMAAADLERWLGEAHRRAARS